MEELNISKLAIGDIYCTNYDGLTVLQILDTTVVTIPKEVIYAKYDTYGDDKYQKQIHGKNRRKTYIGLGMKDDFRTILKK